MIKTKYLILIVVLFLSAGMVIKGQEASNPNVELPDFVITGTDVVNVQKAQKIQPEIVSTVTQGFLKPAFSPEELEIKDLSNPVKDEMQLFDTINYLGGDLKAGTGTYYMPIGKISYAFPFNGGVFDASAYGSNQREHVKFSDRLNIGGEAALSFFVDNESSFLPGAQFKLKGGYDFSSYKFYGAALDIYKNDKRNYHRGTIGLNINDLLNEVFIFGADISNDFSSVNNEEFSENLVKLNGFGKLELANFNLVANMNYKNQFISDSAAERQHSFFGIRPTVGLVFSEVLKAFFGFNYQVALGNNFFSPYASLAFKFNKNLTLYGQFAPYADFITAGEFLKINPYLNVQQRRNIFVENQFFIKASVKYEYDKYFQVNGGVEISTSDNMPYFAVVEETGRFNLLDADGRRIKVFMDFLFHPGPFGVFYGTVEFNRTTDSVSNYLPYNPLMRAEVSYGYNFDFGLSARANLEFNSSSYADLANKIEIDPYYNLGVDLSYKIANNFSLTFALSNLLGGDNYRWYGYKETPLDFIAGVNYKW
jgi:hypothetical protein